MVDDGKRLPHGLVQGREGGREGEKERGGKGRTDRGRLYVCVRYNIYDRGIKGCGKMAEGDKEHHLQVKRFLENKKTTKRGDVNAIIQDFWMDCADTCNMDNINASLMESLTGYNVNQLNAQPSPPPSPPTGIQEEEWNRAHKILRVRTHMHMRTYYMLGTRSS